jgi:flavorubredoxin
MGMRDINLENPIAITRDIYWVGFNDETAKLHCNPYILIDSEDIVFFDPGSIPHFPIVMRKVIDLVRPDQISHVVCSHQDPDVCGNLPVLEDVIGTGEVKIVGHINCLRLIRHYGISSDTYQVEENNFELILKSGRKLEFIFTPFLHSPGAIMTYDHKTKSLFSSDLFGALSPENWHLFNSVNFPESMSLWHETYMPSNKNLRKCMELLETYDISRILPQHGNVIEDEQVPIAIEHLKNLKCGVDLF